MDEVIEIFDESHSRSQADLKTKNVAEIIDISSVEETAASHAIRRSESMYPSSPILQQDDYSFANKDISESIEISAPFLQDDTGSKIANTSSILDKDISMVHGTQQNIARRNNFLDKLIEDSFSNTENVSNNSIEVHCDDVGAKQKQKEVSEIDLITSFSIDDHSLGNHNTKSSKIDNIPKQILTTNNEEDCIPAKPPNMMKERSRNLENDGKDKNEQIVSLDKDTLKTSRIQQARKPDDNLVSKNRNTSTSQKPRMKIRKLNGLKAKQDIVTDVQLEIPLFLDNSDVSDSNGDDKSKQQRRKKRLSQPLSSQNIMLPLVKSHTVDLNDAFSMHDEIVDTKHVSNEFNRLSKYIINGKEYTDDECKEMIALGLQTNKEAFKKANQSFKDNEKAREQIIIEMSNTLLKVFKKIDNNFVNSVKPAVVQTSVNEHGEDKLNKIRFLRRCESVYDFNHDYYYPSETKIMEEKVILFYYDCKDFFIQYSKGKRKLYKTLRESSRKGKQTILVLCELNKFKKQLIGVEEQKYKARVNEQLNNSSYQLSSVERQKIQVLEDLNMSAFDIERRIGYINREWKLKVFTTNSHMEFMELFPNLISLIGKQRMDPAIRFMKYAHINVRSVASKTDITKKTLHEIGRMPELKANKVIDQYPSLQSLFIDFQKGDLQSGDDGKHLFTEKMEKRLYKLFTCTDPNEIIE